MASRTALALVLLFPLSIAGSVGSAGPHGLQLGNRAVSLAATMTQSEAGPILRVFPDLSLYTRETTAQIVVDLAPQFDASGAEAEVRVGGKTVHRSIFGPHTLAPVPIRDLPLGKSQVSVRVVRGDQVLGKASTTLHKATPKPNEVKIDNVSKGLIVDGLPFIPFGFYAVLPIDNSKYIDWEAANGFNLISPYQHQEKTGKIESEQRLKEIQAYLDRCAQVGMKVNYHLMWITLAGLTPETEAALRTEVERFKDHPALLSWYTADEPPLQHKERLERIYQIIKELDPYHPVTIVYYQGAEHARQFSNAMDIVMGDPYPIPNAPVTYVSDMTDSLRNGSNNEKPVWIVPQAFGGNEAWLREPTRAEQRAMTYLALIHGATGIQYFRREPPSNFPKSPAMWAECGEMSLEAAELTPALLSREPRPEVTSALDSVHVGAWRDRGVITVLAVNTVNRPQTVRLTLPGLDFTGEAEVLFENRRVKVENGVIDDLVVQFGSQAYAIPVGPAPRESIPVHPKNIMVNPSFEEQPSPGVLPNCYADIGPGATVFVDSRVARHGRHSLRMIAPSDDELPTLSLWPVKGTEGATYEVSIWAKARTEGVRLNILVPQIGEREFTLTPDWREYSFSGTWDSSRARGEWGWWIPKMGLTSAGTAWLDLLQLVPLGQNKQ